MSMRVMLSALAQLALTRDFFDSYQISTSHTNNRNQAGYNCTVQCVYDYMSLCRVIFWNAPMEDESRFTRYPWLTSTDGTDCMSNAINFHTNRWTHLKYTWCEVFTAAAKEVSQGNIWTQVDESTMITDIITSIIVYCEAEFKRWSSDHRFCGSSRCEV